METRLEQIKSDPNFSYDLSSVERAKKDPTFRDMMVLTPDPQNPFQVHVFQKIRYRQGLFYAADMIKRHRVLKVTQSGDIEIYDGQRKVAEDLNLYLFSEHAINIYEQIKKQNFYRSFENNRFELYATLKDACNLPFAMLNDEAHGLRYRQHCETLELFYKSDISGKMKMDGSEADVVDAAYILSVNRAGELAYQLRYHTKHPDSYSWHPYHSVDETHDPKVQVFHREFIVPLLTGNKMDRSLTL